MPTVRRPAVLFLGIMFLAASSYAGSSPAVQAEQNIETIEVTAKKYDFTPSPIHVKQGSTVRLKITATDRTHGFQIDPYPDGAKDKSTPGLVFASKEECVRLEKNVPQTVEFVAHTPGTYTFKCCVHCGFGHGRMKGQLIVEPTDSEATSHK
ncbi:MAG TPA: cupredoxin domain-containing protein [Terriglobales bacterium]|nr:cupredoxin domain-containing protein [Terriglobales bacterium]